MILSLAVPYPLIPTKVRCNRFGIRRPSGISACCPNPILMQPRPLLPFQHLTLTNKYQWIHARIIYFPRPLTGHLSSLLFVQLVTHMLVSSDRGPEYNTSKRLLFPPSTKSWSALATHHFRNHLLDNVRFLPFDSMVYVAILWFEISSKNSPCLPDQNSN